MSTKTTFKRIALVAVASLGFGLLSVAPSSAAIVSDTLTAAGAATATSSVVSPNTATVDLTVSGISSAASETMTLTGTVVSSPITNNVTTVSFAATAVTAATTAANATVGASNGVVTITAAGRGTAYVTASYAPTVAGTYVIALKATGGLNAQTVVWTVTVTAKPALSVAGSSVLMGYDYYDPIGDPVNTLIRGAWTQPDATTDKAGVSCYAAVSANCARIKVVQGNGSTSSPLLAAESVKITVTGTGPALVSVDGEGPGYFAAPYGAFAVESDAQNTALGLTKWVYVKSNGVPGTATITISAGTLVLATKTITFFGNVASLAVTQTAKSISDLAGASSVATISAKDASGFDVPVLAADFTVSSATELTAQSVTAAGAINVAATATTARNVTLQVDPTATKTGAKTLTVTHTGSKVASTFATTVALDATSSLTVTNNMGNTVPGQKITYTVTSKDAGGNATPDGVHTIAVTTSLSQSQALPTSVTLSGGVGTFDLYAPFTPGVQTVTVKSDDVSASTTSDIVDLVQPATDAASEATDAANAATDAANAAAEAADAATAAAQDAADAVAALAVQVNEQIAELKAQNDALRKQLIALTNLIIKIQKKVKA
jgi:hypothetical protein